MSDVLAIGPHPDDVELSMGGTVALLTAAGRSVTILDLTRGERATRGTPATRVEEATRAARALGAERECLELPDLGVAARDREALARLVAVLRAHRPSLVLALHPDDDHPDHAEGGELVLRAAYVSGLRNYPDSGSDPFRPRRILLGMGRRPVPPTLVVNVSAVYDRKRAALAAYGSQFLRDAGDPLVTPISDPTFLPFVEARDRVYGRRIGVEFGEPFATRQPWDIQDAGQLVGEVPS